MARRVLFIYNDPTAPEALLGAAFSDQGFDVDTFSAVPAEHVRDPAREVPFPDPLDYDVVVPLGSRFSVHDEALRDTWVGAEMAMVRRAVAAGVGVLGVCFGGQLVAQALGGSVGRSRTPELGWFTVASRVPYLAPGPWFQWHSDCWTLPPGAVEIARNANASQAFISGSALALQFHPELDRPLLEVWLGNDTDGDVPRLRVDIGELRRRTDAEQDAAVERLGSLVTGFLTQVVAGKVPG